MSLFWKEATTDKLSIGDVLRVKLSAYSTDAGIIHNGRVVEVVKVLSGDVYVKTIDNRKPKLEDVRHPPNKLERLVIQID